jgi:hypothetical protein
MKLFLLIAIIGFANAFEVNVTHRNILQTQQQLGQYRILGNTGILAIHTALLPNSDSVLIWNRRHKDGTPYQPGVIGPDGHAEVTAVFDTNTAKYVTKVMRAAPFCSGGSHLYDGSVLVAGGDEGKSLPGITNGLKTIRYFMNGNWKNGNVNLANPRWYPTQLQLSDGVRTIIMGGSTKEGGAYVPSAEVFNAANGKLSPTRYLPVLNKNGALYPINYLLPWTITPGSDTVFTFNCAGGNIMTLDKGDNFKEILPLPNLPTPNVCSATSASGGAVMLMLKPESGYTPTVAMFGGYRRPLPKCMCDTPTHNKAHRITLDKKSVETKTLKWDVEDMPGNRNLVDSVLLPNGKVLLVNGASNGVFGTARNPVLQAWIYDPDAPFGKRFKVLASSNIARRYHSTALLLPDGSVFIGGSELGDCPAGCGAKQTYNYEFRSERFLPPYFFSTRPNINTVSTTTAPMAGNIVVSYSGKVDSAVLMKPGAVTHQNDMSQRGIKLKVVSHDTINKKITIQMPPKGGLVAQPGYYMLFLLDRSIPCNKAKWIRLNP